MCEKTEFEQPFPGTVGVNRAKVLLCNGDDTKTFCTSTSRSAEDQFLCSPKTLEESPDPQGHQLFATVQVPYKHRLSLSPGSLVTIHGKPTMSFSNNPKLQVDFHIANDEDSDIAFHFLVYFGDYVVMNSREVGEWKFEVKSYEMPFEDDKPFKLCISVLQNEYQVMVNDKHWYSFPHRVDLRSVEMMEVSRDVSLTSVTICERDG